MAFRILVEVPPPKSNVVGPFLANVEALSAMDVDAVTLSDNSLAQARMANVVAAQLVRQKVGLPVVLHVNTRDRNLLAQQSLFFGLAALGIQDVLIISGDAMRLGDHPEGKTVYERTSIDLMHLVRGMNEGRSFFGRPLKNPTSFRIGGALNPTSAGGFSRERALRKVEAGATFFLTQPLFSDRMLEALDDLRSFLPAGIELYPGFMPLVSEKNARFMASVPGFSVPDSLLRAYAERPEDPEIGVEFLLDLFERNKSLLSSFAGVYLVTPGRKADILRPLVEYLRRQFARK
ncbi:MAG: 5,10-methylenetetrahydrofolate reductase [Brockia lithotrophica]|uniref:Methylenetetrahydrofolate reductase n=1 Tax=Brockia lithotrophica TaxID=933949 RepID=A0A2T5GB52_9BACL|nr:methylenetetrahydrofolate reductase [Brockia lithotrophica]PTQ53413.1 MAG: 5,10-methylenetetrahydrofolate reductase [Brockia lithotrophica]